MPPPAPIAQPQPQAVPPLAPSFDVVRINPQGRAVIAGRAAPGAEVYVHAGAEVVAVARADAFGEWVAVPDDPLGPGPRELSLRAVLPGGGVVLSQQVVTVVVPAREAPAEERALVVLQDRDGAQAPRLLQGAVADPGARAGELALDAVQYDEAGNVVLSGKAEFGAEVRAYVDGRAIGAAAADADGFWQITPDAALEIGRHALRLEQVDDIGAMVARVDVPFVRAAPELTRLAPGEVIVQPGNSLWRIARTRYGEGMLFTVIYLANAGQIEDPDMIFPGQIFRLPAPPGE